MNRRQILALLKEHGWVHARTKGSHMIFKHPEKRETIVVATHQNSGEISIGMERSILKKMGLI
jgi:predicted RNA binding protein YcfA (HicA-like mRNA interferase family)